VAPLFHVPRHFPVGQAADNDEELATKQLKIATTKANFNGLFFIFGHLTL